MPTPSCARTAIAGLSLAAALMAAAAQAQQPPSPPPVGPEAAKNLETFDTLDFVVFSGQKWDRLKESHAADIVVHCPDGREVRGLPQHIEDLKQLFVFAPDTRIKLHPIRIGVGEWTAVTGVMEGTFTRPMTLPDGKVIPPTGKPYKLPMATFGHWKNGVMDHEWLYWDNQAFMKQIGMAE